MAHPSAQLIARGAPFVSSLELAIPRSVLRGHLIEGRVRETVGFSDENSSLIPRQLAAGCSLGHPLSCLILLCGEHEGLHEVRVHAPCQAGGIALPPGLQGDAHGHRVDVQASQEEMNRVAGFRDGH